MSVQREIGAMEIEFIRIGADVLNVEEPKTRRQWMDEFAAKIPYKCLPLVIANQMGVCLSFRHDVTLTWNGTGEMDCIDVQCEDPVTRSHVSSHFGGGVVTFSVPYLIRTPDGVGLFVTGCLNTDGSGFLPLSGYVETWWSPYTFTMNWRVTAPQARLHIPAGTPFCQLIPVRTEDVANLRVTIGRAEDYPLLMKQYRTWAIRRSTHIAETKAGDRHDQELSYMQNMMPDGAPNTTEHFVKLKTHIIHEDE